jgi:hypothetical protein
MNNAHGYLAEFIVANAVGVGEERRVDGDACDTFWNGMTIEVEASAPLRSWDQRW